MFAPDDECFRFRYIVKAVDAYGNEIDPTVRAFAAEEDESVPVVRAVDAEGNQIDPNEKEASANPVVISDDDDESVIVIADAAPEPKRGAVAAKQKEGDEKKKKEGDEKKKKKEEDEKKKKKEEDEKKKKKEEDEKKKKKEEDEKKKKKGAIEDKQNEGEKGGNEGHEGEALPGEDGEEEEPVECAVCNETVEGHAITHVMAVHCPEEPRFGCNRCDAYFYDEKDVLDHISKTHGTGRLIKRGNFLRLALWRFWVWKCYGKRPPVPRERPRMATCGKCGMLVRTGHGHRYCFDHIMEEHGDDKIDYSDPIGVLKKYFSSQVPDVGDSGDGKEVEIIDLD